MFKNVLAQPYWMRVANHCQAHRCLGMAVVMGGAQIAAGAKVGVLSKSAKDCGLNSPMMRLCRSLTKLFIKRFTYKVGAHSSES